MPEWGAMMEAELAQGPAFDARNGTSNPHGPQFGVTRYHVMLASLGPEQ